MRSYLVYLTLNIIFSVPCQCTFCCLTWNWVLNQQPHIIGRRDGVEGKTWLAISEYGHLAFVTDFRELNLNHEGAIRRGKL
jgi:hypothetical protein